MRKRAELLMEIIQNPRPDEFVIRALEEHAPGIELPRVILSRTVFLEVLRQFEGGMLDASELKAWASRLYDHPDIGFEFGNEGALEEATYMLAYSEIHGMADDELCRHIETMLERRESDRF
ncbi:MAG: hypothetical protein IPM27_00815 [Nitrosomonadales bacterium]|nr:hypothetical protein [Nitrosomonadales bacterium]